MSDPVVVPNFDDPCAAYRAVRNAYYRVIAGGAAIWVEFGDRRVRYSEANADRLEKLMGELKAECVAQRQAGGRRRYALGSTFRNRG